MQPAKPVEIHHNPLAGLSAAAARGRRKFFDDITKAVAAGLAAENPETIPPGRKKAEKSREQIKREKSYLSLLKEYTKWQEAQAKKPGRKRLGPADWLKAKSLWSQRSKSFFGQLCGEKDGTDPKILTNAIKYARKIDREKNSGD